MPNKQHKARITQILAIRLDGAELWDVHAFIAEKEAAGEDPWTVAPDASPFSADQIDNLIRAADAIIHGSYPDFPPELAQHIAQRKNLFARAVQSGELAIATRLLKDIAQLEDVCPAKGPAPKSGINETKAALLLEIQRRHLAAIDAPRPCEEVFEHGPQFSAVQWFDCAGDDAARMRWNRTMAELADDNLVIGHRADGAKWPHVRLSDDGQAILTDLNATPTLKITA